MPFIQKYIKVKDNRVVGGFGHDGGSGKRTSSFFLI
jgi:hypothetical protein